MDSETTTYDFESVKEQIFLSFSAREHSRYRRAYELAQLRSNIAELVFETRGLMGLTQMQLAKLAGTSQSLISSVENGKHLPGLLTLRKITDALNLPLTLRVGESIYSVPVMAS